MLPFEGVRSMLFRFCGGYSLAYMYIQGLTSTPPRKRGLVTMEQQINATIVQYPAATGVCLTLLSSAGGFCAFAGFAGGYYLNGNEGAERLQHLKDMFSQ